MVWQCHAMPTRSGLPRRSAAHRAPIGCDARTRAIGTACAVEAREWDEYRVRCSRNVRTPSRNVRTPDHVIPLSRVASAARPAKRTQFRIGVGEEELSLNGFHAQSPNCVHHRFYRLLATVVLLFGLLGLPLLLQRLLSRLLLHALLRVLVLDRHPLTSL